MAAYIPGAFKKAILKSIEEPIQKDQVKNEENQKNLVKEDISMIKLENTDNREILPTLKDNLTNNKENKKEPEYIVKPVEKVGNATWVKPKIETVNDKNQEKKDEVKPISYLRRDVFLRRKKYEDFVQKEWESLWDIYELLVNYDERFLDKLRDNNKGFNDLSKLVFLHLKKYE